MCKGNNIITEINPLVVVLFFVILDSCYTLCHGLGSPADWVRHVEILQVLNVDGERGGAQLRPGGLYGW